MPSPEIKINCGCKFRTASIHHAQSHANKTGHTLHILGEIFPDTPTSGLSNDLDTERRDTERERWND